MNKFFAMALAFVTVINPITSAKTDATAVIDKVDGNYVIVDFSNGKKTKTLEILYSDLNGDIIEGAKIPVKKVVGEFMYTSVNLGCDGLASDEKLYQFYSDNNKVWWVLTESEIGCVPNMGDKYMLYYTDNATTEKTRFCNCMPEQNCECYLYDDIFFHIERCQ